MGVVLQVFKEESSKGFYQKNKQWYEDELALNFDLE